jgi:hypothetical protein
MDVPRELTGAQFMHSRQTVVRLRDQMLSQQPGQCQPKLGWIDAQVLNDRGQRQRSTPTMRRTNERNNFQLDVTPLSNAPCDLVANDI